MSNEYTVNASDLTNVANAIREKSGTTEPLLFPDGFVSAIQEIKSGGGSLNLISVSDVDNLPQTANENTIAVITEQTIGNLYIVSTIPENANDSDMIILSTMTEKRINLSENGIVEIGVAGAYIKIDGVWSFIDTYIFTNDAWSFLWSAQLYYSGNEYEDYTGGWIGAGKKSTNNSTVSAGEPIITRGEESLTADTQTKLTGGIFYTSKQVDLTPYKTIVFEGDFTRGGTVERNFTIAVWSSIGTYYTSNVLTSITTSSTSFTKITLDVSDINKLAYIGLGLTQSKAVITRCYLVPNDL